MSRPFQICLLAFGVLILLVVGSEITFALLAITHGNRPAPTGCGSASISIRPAPVTRSPSR
ncbi:MAG TPA: hypothetical protein VGF67_18225 [Ktedonobacteraceae bacterium]|jgi:hypothetical protein